MVYNMDFNQNPIFNDLNQEIPVGFVKDFFPVMRSKNLNTSATGYLLTTNFMAILVKQAVHSLEAQQPRSVTVTLSAMEKLCLLLYHNFPLVTVSLRTTQMEL